MRYASYALSDGVPTWGVEIDGRLHDLGPTGAGLAADLHDAVRRGIVGTVDPASIVGDGTPEAEVEFLPCIVDPGKILCIGVNYRTHQAETGRADVAAPTVFTRFADSQLGHGRPAIFPATSEQFDYEGELALVIGRGGWRIPKDEALEHVAGYAPYNDFSVRDWQRATSQWIPGKNFPGTGAFGPYLVPAADIEDVTALRLQTRVNGEVRQDALLSDLVFDIPELIAHVSGFTPLSPGDVIVTGTPGGVGLFMTPSGLLSDGDVVEVEVTGMPVLRNTVAKEIADSSR